jgi:hypothetical protein
MSIYINLWQSISSYDQHYVNISDDRLQLANLNPANINPGRPVQLAASSPSEKSLQRTRLEILKKSEEPGGCA